MTYTEMYKHALNTIIRSVSHIYHVTCYYVAYV